jgi:hypothetical protein
MIELIFLVRFWIRREVAAIASQRAIARGAAISVHGATNTPWRFMQAGRLALTLTLSQRERGQEASRGDVLWR